MCKQAAEFKLFSELFVFELSFNFGEFFHTFCGVLCLSMARSLIDVLVVAGVLLLGFCLASFSRHQNTERE